MPGFNYGGNSVGDGTNWSSERGSDPTTPGGGDNGHAGDHCLVSYLVTKKF